MDLRRGGVGWGGDVGGERDGAGGRVGEAVEVGDVGTACAWARWGEATRGGGEGRVGNASAEGKTRKKGVEAGCR